MNNNNAKVVWICRMKATLIKQEGTSTFPRRESQTTIGGVSRTHYLPRESAMKRRDTFRWPALAKMLVRKTWKDKLGNVTYELETI